MPAKYCDFQQQNFFMKVSNLKNKKIIKILGMPIRGITGY